MTARTQTPLRGQAKRAAPVPNRIARGLAALADDLYRVLVGIAILVYTWVFAGLAIAQHLGMRTHKADLGQIDQAVWNSSRGRFVEMTDFGFLATRMTDHVEPVLALISPIYWFWDDTRALLILQTLFVASGAWFLYHFTVQQFLGTLPAHERDTIWHTDALLGMARPIALSLALAYLLAPPLQAAVLTEFHAVPLVVPMVLWALWAVGAQRWGQFAAAVLLVATVKEETALLAAGLGVWAIWRMTVVARLDPGLAPPTTRRPLLLAGTLTLLSLVWFYVATFVIVPAHAEPVYGVAESSYFARYGALGDSPADILRSFFAQPGLVWEIATEPVRIDYLRRLLMPFGYLSLLAPDVILLSLPVLLANQLSAYPAQYYGEYHYSAPVIVYFAAAAAVGAARLWRILARPLSKTSAAFQHLPTAPAPLMQVAALFQNARTALRPLLALSLSVWLVLWGGLSYLDAGRGPGGPRLDATPVTAHHRLMARFTAQIPRDARVTATAAVHPHVSHRRFVYQFPTGLDAPTPPEQQADWALLNVTMAIDMAPGDLRARVEEMLANEWGVVDAADGFLLLHKGAPEKRIPPAFYTFAAGPPPDTAPVQSLTLLATEVIDRPYWRATQIVSTWQVGEGFDLDHFGPELAVHGPDGERVVADVNAIASALTWSPPSTWEPGHAARVSTLPHYLPDVWGVVVIDAVGPRLVAAYYRGEHDVLHPLPVGSHAGDAQELATLVGLEPHAPARFRITNEIVGASIADAPGEIRLQAWTSPEYNPVPLSPVGEHGQTGGGLHVLLEWETGGAGWPRALNVFVHLRAGDDNQAQADGRPRYFIDDIDFMAADAGDEGRIWDWRRLTLSDELLTAARGAATAQWFVVVGLYDLDTGNRAALLNHAGEVVGNELVLGPLRLAPRPEPDQTCALIPATCWSQP